MDKIELSCIKKCIRQLYRFHPLFILLIFYDIIGQLHQAVRKMYILNNHIFVDQIKVHMGKIPDCLNSKIDQTVCNGISLLLRHGKGCNINNVTLQ